MVAWAGGSDAKILMCDPELEAQGPIFPNPVLLRSLAAKLRCFPMPCSDSRTTSAGSGREEAGVEYKQGSEGTGGHHPGMWWYRKYQKVAHVVPEGVMNSDTRIVRLFGVHKAGILGSGRQCVQPLPLQETKPGVSPRSPEGSFPSSAPSMR